MLRCVGRTGAAVGESLTDIVAVLTEVRTRAGTGKVVTGIVLVETDTAADPVTDDTAYYIHY